MRDKISTIQFMPVAKDFNQQNNNTNTIVKILNEVINAVNRLPDAPDCEITIKDYTQRVNALIRHHNAQVLENDAIDERERLTWNGIPLVDCSNKELCDAVIYYRELCEKRVV